MQRFAAQIAPGGNVLDLACGSGRHSRYLAELGYRVEALDRDVRTACCRLLGNRKDPQAVQPLSRIVGAEADMEVRMAAIDALGQYESTDAVVGLAAAIKDRDPALQYAGVKAMKSASGKDLGNDVEAWRQYAATLTPTSPGSPMSGSEVNIARTPSGEPGVR